LPQAVPVACPPPKSAHEPSIQIPIWGSFPDLTAVFTISYFFGKPLSAHLAKTEVTLLLSETPVFEKLYETETGKYLKTKDVGK
jgi:hypothetical protein